MAENFRYAVKRLQVVSGLRISERAELVQGLPESDLSNAALAALTAEHPNLRLSVVVGTWANRALELSHSDKISNTPYYPPEIHGEGRIPVISDVTPINNRVRARALESLATNVGNKQFRNHTELVGIGMQGEMEDWALFGDGSPSLILERIARDAMSAFKISASLQSA